MRAPPARRRPTWRTLLWIVGVVLVAILVAYLLTPHGGAAGGGHGRGAAAGGAPGRRPPTVVGVATASLGDIPIQITALGSVTPQANVTVRHLDAGLLQGGPDGPRRSAAGPGRSAPLSGGA
jgi:multidrug efflux system membrane fusion protein